MRNRIYLFVDTLNMPHFLLHTSSKGSLIRDEYISTLNMPHFLQKIEKNEVVDANASHYVPVGKTVLGKAVVQIFRIYILSFGH